ncbi:ABC transporter substrate-binding protein [Pseudochelatococcus sp. B33]
MNLRRRFVMLAGAVALAATMVSAPVYAAGNELLTLSTPDRAEKLEAAAKEEGTLTLYTSVAQSDVQPLIKPFEEKYGIKVVVWRASGDTVLQRVIQEQRAGRNTVDVVHVGAPELEALHREGMLQPIESPYFGDLLEGSVPEHKEWVSTLLSVWVQAYNTNLISKDELPKTYADLLDPKWKGKLGYEMENIDWFTTVIQTMGEEEGLKFFRDLVATNGLSIRKGHSLLNTLVAAGEVPVGLTLYNYMPSQAKSQGAPIDWFAIEPAVARSNGVGVIKTAQHPNAAALFADYMLSEAQPVLTSLSYVPASTKVESPLDDIEIAIADPAKKLDGAEKWEPLYQEIVVRGRAN